MIKTLEIAFFAYPVSDVARARSFYENVLNLKSTLSYEWDNVSWIEYDIGATTIAITNMGSETWKPSKNGGSAALEVEDFNSAVQTLREAKATFYLEPMESPACQMAVVADPDGNSLCIHKRKG